MIHNIKLILISADVFFMVDMIHAIHFHSRFVNVFSQAFIGILHIRLRAVYKYLDIYFQVTNSAGNRIFLKNPISKIPENFCPSTYWPLQLKGGSGFR